MQRITKIFGVLAAVAVGLSLATGCPGTTESTTEDITATLWKDAGKLDGEAFTEIAYSAPNTYAANKDNLFWLGNDGKWAKVDVTKGTNHGATGKVVAIAGASKLTALSDGRIVATTAAKDVIIVKAGETTDFWAVGDAGITRIGAAAINSIAVVNNAIVISDGTITLKAQFDTTAGKFAQVWDLTLQAKDKAFDKTITLLAVDTAGDLFAGSNEAPLGFYKFEKAKIATFDAGKAGIATTDVGTVALMGANANAIWNDAALPKGLVFTTDGAVVIGNQGFGFLSKAEANKAAGAAVDINDSKNVAIANITSIKGEGSEVLAFSATGMYTIDKDGKAIGDIFEGDFKGNNFADTTDFAKSKLAGLAGKEFKLGTKIILNMVKSGDTTYYVTDKGVFVGTEKVVKVLKP